MLDTLKLRLRITNNAYDDEITELIDEAKERMILHGVDPLKINVDDMNVKSAIINYVKANFGLDNQDSPKYMNSFMECVKILTLTTYQNGAV
jgi:uncharacterized phage protein (predicted DNA packaging)